MSDVTTISITMSVRLWSGIDGGLDNKATNSMWQYWDSGGDIGDPERPDVGPVSRFARAIREEGWRQVDTWKRPAGEFVEVTLTGQQWEFILADARDSLPIYEELAAAAAGRSKHDMQESAELCRMTITVVGRALGPDPGRTP
ncbi:MAG TPA: hypothetical protein VIC62_06945 [Nakamurella sp.]|jgi:hypothetical protein